MQTKDGLSAEWIVKTLTSGRFAEKLEAQRLLENERATFDRNAIRHQLLRLLREEYHPERDSFDETSDIPGVRCWLLSSLGRLPSADGEPQKTLRGYIHEDFERNPWARYWALEALLRRSHLKDIVELCEPVAQRDRDNLPKMLATAILALAGQKEPQELIRSALKPSPETERDSEETRKANHRRWSVLRALRFVYLPFAVPLICKLVQNGRDDNITYDAIVALSNVPIRTQQAEDAALTLAAFITKSRRYQAWEVMRIRAIDALGRLSVESTSTLLLEELIDFNPAVAKAAAEALETILGPPTTAARVLEALVKREGTDLARFARGLREMQDQKAIADQLGVALLSTTGGAQGYAQQLLSTIGGTAAFEKLRSLTKSTEHYLRALEEADKSLRDLFNDTINEARTGFKVVIAMDIIVFMMGVGLMATSAILALQDPTPLKAWTSVMTGAGGVMAVIYGRFVAKPREQVENSVQYLSGLKAVFLGYLRQLRQTDQAYTRRVLEDEKLTAAETKEFNKLVEDIMENSVKRLTARPPAPSESSPRKASQHATVATKDSPATSSAGEQTNNSGK